MEIAASPETVFAAITDPEQLKQWWGDGKNYKVERWEGDVRVGARYRSVGTGHTGDPFEVTGEYVAVDRRGCSRTHGKPVEPREYQPVWFVGN